MFTSSGMFQETCFTSSCVFQETIITGSVLRDKFTYMFQEKCLKISKCFREISLRFHSFFMSHINKLLNASGQMFKGSVKFQETCFTSSCVFQETCSTSLALACFRRHVQLLHVSVDMFTSSHVFQETCLRAIACSRTNVFHLTRFRRHVYQHLHVSGDIFTSSCVFRRHVY
jgi:hypothetical protein